jgi:uncharacterized protein (TIGR00725 family)
MRPVIAVFGSSTSRPGDGWWEQGLECGRRLAAAGYDVATGGYGGLMQSVSQGAAEAGARVYGVTAPPCFPYRPGPNEFVDEEIPAATIPERMERIIDLGAGYIVLDGSIGTLTEMLVAWNIAHIDDLSELPFKPVEITRRVPADSS